MAPVAGRLAIIAWALTVSLAACGDPVGTTTTTTTVAPVTVPPGVLAAVPFQNRLDVAQGIFQLKLYNGTSESLAVEAVQLVWAGMTTPVAARRNPLAAGDRVDFPVPLVAASCAGDGTAATMPSLADAVAKVTVEGGRVLDVPVFDTERVATKLYVDDCARQHIESQVHLEWVGLHAAPYQGRPVTEGALRVTRRAATAAVKVLFVGNTVNYTFEAASPQPDAIGVLPTGAPSVDIPARFIEGRCDAHALSESSQPFNFVVTVDLGDGAPRTIAIVPSAADQLKMRDTLLDACRALGRIGFVGQDDTGGVTTTTATG